jgi:hypothetical protein
MRASFCPPIPGAGVEYFLPLNCAPMQALKALGLWAGMPTIRLRVLMGNPATCAMRIFATVLSLLSLYLDGSEVKSANFMLAPDSLSLCPY